MATHADQKLRRSSLLDLTGAHSRIVQRPRPQDDPEQRRRSISLAQELPDWKTRTMLKNGLARND
jgi:UDP-glucuronate decarboxylase